MSKERYLYIDYGKAIGILLIIFGHVAQYFTSTQEACYYVCSFHVPIFFVLGGCLSYYKRNANISFISLISKRAKSLLIPYIVFSIINSGIKFAVLFLQSELTSHVIKEELVQLFITGNGTVWFCLTYFIVEIVFFSVKKIRKYEFVMPFIGIICTILPYLFSWNKNPFGIVFVRALAGIGFYVFGYYFVKFIKLSKLKLGFCILICILAFSLQATVYFTMGSGYAFFTGVFTNPIASLLNSFLGAVGILMLANSLEKMKINAFLKSFLNYFGQNSLPIMLIHPTLLLVFTYPLRELMLSAQCAVSLILSILLFIGIVFLNLPFVYIIKRWFPWMIGIKTKKQNNAEPVSDSK